MTIIRSTVKCPYPNCGHTGDLITNLHCKSAHNMERKELFGRYGEPTKVRYDREAAKKNLEGHVRVNEKDRRTTRKIGGR